MRAPAARVALTLLLLVMVAAAGCTSDAPKPTKTTPKVTATKAPVTSSVAPPPTTSTAPTSIAAPPPGQLDGRAPELVTGDYWVEEHTGIESPTEIHNTSVDGTERLTLEGATYQSYRTVDRSTFNGFQTNSTRWLRQEDLAFLKLNEYFGPPGHGSDHLQTSSPPCAGAFPLRVGILVSRSCKLHDSLSGGQVPQGIPPQETWSNSTIEVVGIENITVKAGTFQAYRIITTRFLPDDAEQATTIWWAPAACGRVRSVTETDDGTILDELASFHCAHARVP